VIYRVTESGRDRLLKFDDRPCENVDFLSPNLLFIAKQAIRFQNGAYDQTWLVPMAVLHPSKRSQDNKDGQVEESILDRGKLREALREYFGINVNFP
jgi:N-hydroxyarylamine O-acetyltransferase